MFAYNLRGVYHCLIPDYCVRICEIPNRQEQSANNAFFVSQAASRHSRAKPGTLPQDAAQSVGCLWQTAQSYAKKSIRANATAKKMWRLGESFVILQAVIKAGKPGRSLRGQTRLSLNGESCHQSQVNSSVKFAYSIEYQ